MTPALEIERVLRETRTVAIVGASANPRRASHEVWSYLKSASDYELYLVNPTISEVDGTPVYPSLADLPVARASARGAPGRHRGGREGAVAAARLMA
jgi:predicted CoA-binding protein